MENILTQNINSIWTAFITAVGCIAVYAIVAVIWFIRLEGKLKTNQEIFRMFVEQCKEKDKKIEKNIDDLFELTRKVENMVTRVEGRINGQQ